MLYIIATPIGNLEDITIRALKILRKVKYIFAEDTRRINILLQKYKIKDKKLESFHKFNELRKMDKIIKMLQNNIDIAIVSDAGTPLISDPGEAIVKECFKKDIKITPIPGVSALTTLLSVCPFENKEFIFVGFIEKVKEKRKNQFIDLLKTGKNIFFFESPKRIIKTLEILNEISPKIKIIIGRELTKYYEEILFDTPLNLIKYLNRSSIVGEFTVGIYNNLEFKTEDYLNDIELMKNLKISKKDIILFISKKYNIKKNKIYELLKENA